MKATSVTTPFQTELIRELKRIRRAQEVADGCSGMGFDCIYQHINFRNLPSAPKGTNAVYFIREELRKLLSEREFQGFLLK
jgi:hypothetical protein